MEVKLGRMSPSGARLLLTTTAAGCALFLVLLPRPVVPMEPPPADETAARAAYDALARGHYGEAFLAYEALYRRTGEVRYRNHALASDRGLVDSQGGIP